MKKVVRSNTKKLTGIRTWQDNLRKTIAAPLVQSVQRRENCGGGSGGGGAGEAGLSSSGRFSRADDENFQVCWKCQCLFCNCQNVPSVGVYLTPDFGAKQFFSYCCPADIGLRLPANQLYNKKIDFVSPKSGDRCLCKFDHTLHIRQVEEEMVPVLIMNESEETDMADHCFSSTACDSKPGRTFSA